MSGTAKLTLLMIVATACLCGCGQPPLREGASPGVNVNHPMAPYAKPRMNSVGILDKSLADWQGRDDRRRSKIAVEATDSKRTQTGTLQVWATLRNRTDYPLQIEGRTHFYGPDQDPVEGPTAWQRLHLPANSVGHYKEFSTRIEGIEFYYIEIREGR